MYKVTIFKERIKLVLRRKLWNNIDRLRLNNKNFSIISQNCIGTLMSHDLGCRFNTPTVNLYFESEDFVKFVERLKYYLNIDLKFEQFNSYPIGILDDIKIHFLHYKSNREAYEKWNDRKNRINYNNLFFIMTDRDNCNESLMKRFDNIKYNNKVIFSSKHYENINSLVYIKKYEKEKCVGNLTSINITGRRQYSRNFDYVSWINKGAKSK